MRVRRFLQLACLGLAGTLLGSLVGEGVLRALEPSIEYALQPPGLRQTLNTEELAMPGVSGPSRFSVNAWGVRGDLFAEGQDYRILALGGSTTICGALDDHEAWPYRLQEELNRRQPDLRAWVGNAGRDGMTTRHHRLHMELLLPIYPRIDAVILLVGGNDFLLRVRRGRTYKPLWNESPVYHERLKRDAFAVSREQRSGLKLLLWERVRRLVVAGLRPARAQYRYPVARMRRAFAPKQAELTDLSWALEEFRRNLTEIADSADRHGVRLLLATQPGMWRADLPVELQGRLWMGDISDSGSEKFLAVEALAAGLERYNRELISFCARRGLECVDLASELPRDTSAFYDDLHFNEAGAEQVARVLADSLLKNAPFGDGASRGKERGP